MNIIGKTFFTIALATLLNMATYAAETPATKPFARPNVRDLITRHEEAIKDKDDGRLELRTVRDFDQLKKIAHEDTNYEVYTANDYSNLPFSYTGPKLVRHANPWRVTGKDIKEGFFDTMIPQGLKLMRVVKALK